MTDEIFEAYDKSSYNAINLFKIIVSMDGKVIALEDRAGAMYGMHQVELVIFRPQKEKEEEL